MVTCEYGENCADCEYCTNEQVLLICEGAGLNRDVEFALSKPEDFILSIPYDQLEALLSTDIGQQIVNAYIGDNQLEYAKWLGGAQ